MTNNPYETKYISLLESVAPVDPLTKFGKNVRLGVGVIIEKDCSIGDDSFIGHYCVLRPEVKIGKKSMIGHLTVFEGESTIGNRVLIHSQCHITKGVIIEDDVFIAPFFCGANTAQIVHGRNYPLILEAYRIKRAARIGIGVLVLPGVVIGENAQIGVGSVVTKNVPDGECWFGNPVIGRAHV